MVDSLPPLPIVNNAWVARTQVADGNPHHQQPQQRKKEREEGIHDEVTISADAESAQPDAEGNDASQNKQKEKEPPVLPAHNIDIEV